MYEEQTRVIAELRAAGYAIIIWAPDEVGTANPRKVEDRQIELGWEIIEALQEDTL